MEWACCCLDGLLGELGPAGHGAWCCGSLNVSRKRSSRHRAFQKGVSLLRTKSREKVGTVSAGGRPPDRAENADSFCGLIANFYSLKTKNIPAGRLALGDWLGHYRAVIRRAFSNHCRGTVSLRGDLGSVLRFCGLGAGLHTWLFSRLNSFLSTLND